MFIRTNDNRLVNMKDKDICIKTRWSTFDHYECTVTATGPMAYGWSEDFIGGSEIVLHRGTRAECEQYLDWLSDMLNAYKGDHISETPSPIEDSEHAALSQVIEDNVPY